MRHHEIERWTLSVVERTENGDHIEDGRVELKTSWPELHFDAARRIAGHANAARGGPILWLIGVDEKGGRVEGARQTDFVAWWSKVEACFDGVAPSVTDLAVPCGSLSVVALVFDTARAPFVVTTPGGGRITHEVPWRSATAVRSARREDLLKILVPASTVPGCEVFGATLQDVDIASKGSSTRKVGRFSLDFYLLTTSPTPVFLPFHRCVSRIRLPAAEWIELGEIRIAPPLVPAYQEGAPRTLSASLSELRIEGPGRATLVGNLAYSDLVRLREAARSQPDLEVFTALPILGADRDIVIEMRLRRVEDHRSEFVGEWRPAAPEDGGADVVTDS
jgi:hypothetical protein